jgi:hypothetical protein
MADKNLEIQVKLTADTAGAQQAAAEIKRLADEANKKPFVMPIDEAGMKAREEAMRMQAQLQDTLQTETTQAEAAIRKEDQAIDELAKSARKTAQEINDLANSQRKAKESASEWYSQNLSAKFDSSALKTVETTKMVTTTANSAAQAQKQLGDKTTQSAMGFLQFSQAVEDAQYGIRGVLNNIPGMVMSFGGGMGLAGALSLAAVGVTQLSERLDLFGTESKKAQDDVEKTADELAKVAKRAELAAEKSATLAESQKALADAVRFVSVAYEDQTKAADKALRKQQEILDAELKLSDATMERSMAIVDVQEAGGQISGSEAAQRRSAIRAQAAAKRDEIEMKRLAAEEARFRADAEAAAKAASAQDALTRQKFSAANQQKLMTDDERKAADELRKTQEQQMEAAKIEMQRVKQQQMPGGVMDPAQRALIESKMQEDRKKAEEKYVRSQGALAETQQKIADDQEAQRQTGARSESEFIQKRDEERRKAEEFRQKQESATIGAQSAASRAGVLAQTLPIRQETEALKTAAAERQRQRDEQERAAARQAKEREQVGTAGGRLAESLAQGGATSAFVGQLQSAVAQTAAGGSTEQLMQLMQMLMANLSKMDAATREKLQKLQAEVNDLAVAK